MTVAVGFTVCVKTPNRAFGKTKKGSSDPSPLGKTLYIETVEVGFSAVGAATEFSHGL